MDFLCHLCFNIKESMKCCCQAGRKIHRPKYERWPLITISITISSHVSLNKVDQLYVVHFKFHLISSDTKLPKEG